MVTNTPAVKTKLRLRFGYSSYRPGQEEILSPMLAWDDSGGRGRCELFLCADTAIGKNSLPWFAAAHYEKGLTIVVEPIIALINDQVKQAREHGLIAHGWHSLMPASARAQMMDDVRTRKIQLLYIGPEKFCSRDFLNTFEVIADQFINLIVLDEAHLLIQWGESFRAEYLNVPRIIAKLQAKRVLALTGTATPATRKAIAARLRFTKNYTEVVFQPNRPNLRFSAVRFGYPAAKRVALYKELDQLPQGEKALIICTTPREAIELHTWAKENFPDVPGSCYHGELDFDERFQNETRFRNESGFMFATSAFGIGVNIPDIHTVIYYCLPSSIEELYQGWSRGGRDGKITICKIFLSWRDESLRRELVDFSNPKLEFVTSLFDELKAKHTDPRQEFEFFPSKWAEKGARLPRAVIAQRKKLAEKTGRALKLYNERLYSQLMSAYRVHIQHGTLIREGSKFTIGARSNLPTEADLVAEHNKRLSEIDSMSAFASWACDLTGTPEKVSNEIRKAIAHYFEHGELESLGMKPKPLFQEGDFEPLLRSLFYQDRKANVTVHGIERSFFRPGVTDQKISMDLTPEDRRTARALLKRAVETEILRRVKFGSQVWISLTEIGLVLAMEVTGREPSQSEGLLRRLLQPDVLAQICSEFLRWKNGQQMRLNRRRKWASKKNIELRPPRMSQAGGFAHSKIKIFERKFTGSQILRALLQDQTPSTTDLETAFLDLSRLIARELAPKQKAKTKVKRPRPKKPKSPPSAPEAGTAVASS